MDDFWLGFEKRAFIKPHLLRKADRALKKVWGKVPKLSMPKLLKGEITHEIKFDKSTTARLEKAVKDLKEMSVRHEMTPTTAKQLKDMATHASVRHDIAPKTTEQLKEVATHAAEKAEEVKKFKPKDLVVPTIFGGAGITTGALIANRLGKKVLKHTPLRDDTKSQGNYGDAR